MSTVRERDLEAYLVTRVKAMGGLAYKFTSPARCNVPDRVVILRGNVVFVEMKAPGKRPTAAQEREHARMVSAGAAVRVIDSMVGIENLLEALQ